MSALPFRIDGVGTFHFTEIDLAMRLQIDKWQLNRERETTARHTHTHPTAWGENSSKSMPSPCACWHNSDDGSPFHPALQISPPNRHLALWTRSLILTRRRGWSLIVGVKEGGLPIWQVDIDRFADNNGFAAGLVCIYSNYDALE